MRYLNFRLIGVKYVYYLTFYSRCILCFRSLNLKNEKTRPPIADTGYMYVAYDDWVSPAALDTVPNAKMFGAGNRWVSFRDSEGCPVGSFPASPPNRTRLFSGHLDPATRSSA